MFSFDQIIDESSPDLRLQSPYTGVSTPPSAEIPQKSQKGLPGPPRPECQKSVEKSPNTDFGVFLTHFRVIWDFFDTFLTLRAGRPGNTFLRLFGDFGPRRPRHSCIWRLQSQPLIYHPHKKNTGRKKTIFCIYLVS